MPTKLSEIARTDWDLIVAGAGPAGALVAHMVAKEDKKVLLVDKAVFPRSKVCGCCLNASAFAALQEAGIAHILAENNAMTVENFAVHDSLQQASLRIPRGYALSRAVFDAAVVNEAIKSGACFLPGTTAYLEEARSDAVRVCLKDEHELVQCDASILVVADGISGRTLAGHKEFDFEIQPDAKFGAGAILPGGKDLIDAGTIYMACANQGYVGMVRLENGQIDVAAALCTSFSRECGGPAKAAEKILRSCKLPIPDNLAQSSWHGTEPLTRKRKKLAGQRIFVVGDAGSYAEPLTGEGISWALWSALTASNLVVAAIDDWSMELATNWQSIRHRLIDGRQRNSKFIACLFSHPFLRTATLAGLRLIPALAQPILTNLKEDGMLEAVRQMNHTIAHGGRGQHSNKLGDKLGDKLSDQLGDQLGDQHSDQRSEEPCPQAF